jgi:hypothetical protein
MNICTIFNTIKINLRLDFGRDNWPNIHIQILAIIFILSFLMVNEEGLKLGPQVEMTTLKVRE